MIQWQRVRNATQGVDLGDDFCPDCGASINESIAAKTEKIIQVRRV